MNWAEYGAPPTADPNAARHAPGARLATIRVRDRFSWPRHRGVR